MSLFDDYCPDPFEDENERESKSVTCKRCGKGSLHWVEYYNSKYKLFDGPRQHVCKNDCADDFDVLD